MRKSCALFLIVASLAACGSDPDREVVEAFAFRPVVRRAVELCLHRFRPGDRRTRCLCAVTHDQRWCRPDAGAPPDSGGNDGASPPDAGTAPDAAAIVDAGPPDAGEQADATAGSDAGNIPACGNTVLDPGEACDPPNFTTCDESCQSIPIVCGNGIVQPGENCEWATATLCNNCLQTACGGCFAALAGGGSLCLGLNAADSLACNKLVGCGTSGMATCAAGGAGALGCYCQFGDCSAGANGPCAAQFEALAHSSDPAIVSKQIADPTTPVGQVAASLKAFAGSSCGRTCAGL